MAGKHDPYHKRLLKPLRLARHFVAGSIQPRAVANLSLDMLQVQPTTFVADNLRERRLKLTVVVVFTTTHNRGGLYPPTPSKCYISPPAPHTQILYHPNSINDTQQDFLQRLHFGAAKLSIQSLERG